MRNPYAGSKEYIQHKVNTNLRLFVNRLHVNIPPHWHTDIEIIWPVEAPYTVICGAQTYDVAIGDIILICPAVLHEIFSPTPGARLYFQADFSGITALKELDMIFRLMSPALHVKKDSCPPEIYNQLCNYLNAAMELYFGSIPSLSANGGRGDEEEKFTASTELESYGELELYSILMQLIAFCGRNLPLFTAGSTIPASAKSKNNISLNNICNYISEHFAENLTLEGIASHAGFSKFHFERIFSEYTGMTFYQYLQQIRINYAQTLLSNPDLSVTDISYQSGFTSCATFTRAFKKCTGYPPSQFRMLNETQHPLKLSTHISPTPEE